MRKKRKPAMVKARRKSVKPRRRRAKPMPSDIPNKASIIATDTLVMPGGRRYTIVETDQTDPYDVAPKGGKRRR